MASLHRPQLSFGLLRKGGQTELVETFDEEREPEPSPWSSEKRPETPESAWLRSVDAEAVQHALGTLPPKFREVVVLRELEQCFYKEIADIAQIPMAPSCPGSLERGSSCTPASPRLMHGGRRRMSEVHLGDALHAYIDNELGVEQALEARAHLETCPRCRKDFEQVRALRDVLVRGRPSASAVSATLL
jgi:hypothetical protein